VLNHAFAISGGAPKLTIDAANGALPAELKERLTEAAMAL
jgi:hypothetical protein